MIFLTLFLSTILFFAFAVAFYYYGAVLAYHKRAKAFEKALFFSAATFALYIMPIFLIGEASLTVFLVVLLWSLFWFCVVYKQAMSTWQRTIR